MDEWVGWFWNLVHLTGWKAGFGRNNRYGTGECENEMRWNWRDRARPVKHRQIPHAIDIKEVGECQDAARTASNNPFSHSSSTLP